MPCYVPVEERLISRSIPLANGCIITSWKKTQRGGHTLVTVKGKKKQAHRLAWECFVGPIPTNMQVNHTCHNPKCINTNHLYIGTQKDNIRDMINRGTFPYKNLVYYQVNTHSGTRSLLLPDEKRERHRLACKAWRLKQKPQSVQSV